MNSADPEILLRSDGESGLAWTILASALVHALAIVTVLYLPYRFVRATDPSVSYTVDLVSPQQVGGTNLTEGRPGKPAPGRALQAAAVQSAKPAGPPRPVEPVQAPPAPVKHEAPKPVPKPEKVAVPEPQPPPKVQEAAAKPPASEAKVEKPAVTKQEPAAPSIESKPEPKPEPKPEVEKKPEQKAAEVKGAPEPKAQPEKKTQAPPKAEVEKKAEAPKSVPAGQAPDAKSAAKVQEVAKPTGAEAASSEVTKRDQAIAAAVARRAGQVSQSEPAGGTAVKSTNDRSTSGGPLSIGPGEGSGGFVKGVEYLLYYNSMISRIRDHWAWAGAGGSLEAVVQFNLTAEGEIVNVRTVRSSGDPSYDASVERAVRGASPLGPPPERYREEFATVELTFRPEDLRS